MQEVVWRGEKRKMVKGHARQVTIVPKRGSASVLLKIIKEHSLCFYLSDDYAFFIDLQDKVRGVMEIENLSGLFDKTFQDMKEAILELVSGLNKKYSSYAWWGGRVASKSTSATSLFLNIVYFLCAKRLLLEKHENMIFIVDSPALSACISDFSRKQGYEVNDCKNQFYEWREGLKRYLYYIAQIGSFALKALKNRRAALKALKPFLEKKSHAQKRVVIRSWITQDICRKSTEFKDRNFGYLPQWLRSRGYEVWILPMFFNLSVSIDKVYACIKDRDQAFLIPEHYLKISDYAQSLFNGYKVFSQRIEELRFEGVDVSPLFNEILRRQGFDVHLCMLNLSCHALKRLKQAGFEIDSFYYALECNAPENQFILSCRKYFPNADVIGFQHTAFFPNQLAYRLAPRESEHHPLPDKIICSGPVYKDLYRKSGFPVGILANGPNLRFESVYWNRVGKKDVQDSHGDEKRLLLPLTFSYNLAFDLFVKVRDALRGMGEYTVYIRTHPLLSKKVLIKFLGKINMKNYVFADEGTMQEWLSKMYAVVSTGGTITILETVAFGIPVIRVIPDNVFYYDPFSTPDYPLKPVNTSLEIRAQLQSIDEIQKNGKGVFEAIAKEVLSDYFSVPNEENLKVFL